MFPECVTGKHVVFGEMVEGDEVLTFIESCGTEKDDVTDGVPKYSVIIADCGVVEGTCDAYRSVDEIKK
jgi:cyclophilin family peptidyl-prolyl cis-trans isomerase